MGTVTTYTAITNGKVCEIATHSTVVMIQWCDWPKSRPARPNSLNTGPAKPETRPGQTSYCVIAVLWTQREHATSLLLLLLLLFSFMDFCMSDFFIVVSNKVKAQSDMTQNTSVYCCTVVQPSCVDHCTVHRDNDAVHSNYGHCLLTLCLLDSLPTVWSFHFAYWTVRPLDISPSTWTVRLQIADFAHKSARIKSNV